MNMSLLDTNANKLGLAILTAIVVIFSLAIFNGVNTENMTTVDDTFAIANKECNSMSEVKQDLCEKVAKESHEHEIDSAEAQRNIEKLGEIKKDKTVNFDEFDNIYHVKA